MHLVNVRGIGVTFVNEHKGAHRPFSQQCSLIFKVINPSERSSTPGTHTGQTAAWAKAGVISTVEVGPVQCPKHIVWEMLWLMPSRAGHR